MFHCTEAELQWGHDFDVVEDDVPRLGTEIGRKELQWGHDFDVVEDEDCRTQAELLEDASMGPRL